MNSSDSNSNDSSPKVIQLAAFRAKKDVKEELARGRNPLFVSHMDGKIKGSPYFEKPKAEDFGDRLQRIRTSLEKINRLMTELKKISKDETKKKERETNISFISRQ